MFTGTEVIALLTAILTPILGGFSVMFATLLRSMTGRLEDAGKAADKLAETYKDRLSDKDRELEAARNDVEYFRELAYRGVTATERATNTADRALEVAQGARRDNRR
jgi:hypothetical protein